MEERRRCWLLLKPTCLIMHYRISVTTIAKASDGRQHGHGLPQRAHHVWDWAGCSKACSCALLACCRCFGQLSAATLHRCISTAEFSKHGMSASKPRKLQNLKHSSKKTSKVANPKKKTPNNYGRPVCLPQCEVQKGFFILMMEGLLQLIKESF
jgi:hypothetical protein